MKITFICESCSSPCRIVTPYEHNEEQPLVPGSCPFDFVWTERDCTAPHMVAMVGTDRSDWTVENPVCQDCDGSGYVTRHEVQKAENYMPRSVEYDYDDFCPACGGTGYLPNQKASEQ